MSTPITSPLTEKQITFFSRSKAVAIFSENGKSFVGSVSILEHDTNPGKEDVTMLRVTFLWLAEVEKDFLSPVKNGLIQKGGAREFPNPRKIEKLNERKEVLVCCAGEKYDQKIKLSRYVTHVLAILEVGKECGLVETPTEESS